MWTRKPAGACNVCCTLTTPETQQKYLHDYLRLFATLKMMS